MRGRGRAWARVQGEKGPVRVRAGARVGVRAGNGVRARVGVRARAGARVRGEGRYRGVVNNRVPLSTIRASQGQDSVRVRVKG